MSADITLVSTFASLPRTTRGLPLVISAKPDGSKLLYCNGNSVYIRDVDDVTKTEIYTEHATLTTVAKYSPTGFYIASGDQSGKIRIWDTINPTHILKGEYPVICGPIRDIAWDSESKRIAAVGEAREKFGHIFLFDTGSSNGSLSGQNRPMNSVDFKPNRPFRVVSGSEDRTVAIFEGPPFKFSKFMRTHDRFVHSVRYNKDGSLFVSGGADGRIILYEGTDGTVVEELADQSLDKSIAHSSGVFAVTWSPCNKKIASASSDKTIKIWNVESKKLEKTVTFANNLNNQQLGLVWIEKGIVSVNLAGFLSYIDPETGTIGQVIKGHNKPITAAVLSTDKHFLFTADFEGNITRWETQTGKSERLEPSPHKSQISGLALMSKDILVSIAWDDTIAFTENVFSAIDNVQSENKQLVSQPRGISNSGDTSVVVAHKNIFVFVKKELKTTVDFDRDGACVALSKNEKFVAVGALDGEIRIYELASGHKLNKKTSFTHDGAVTSLEYSGDGTYLVVTDSVRRVVPYKVDAGYERCSEKDWKFHNARVNCAAWSPNGRYVASGGLDTNINVYDVQHSGEPPLIMCGAHQVSPINWIGWLNENTLITIGHDSNVKKWSVNL